MTNDIPCICSHTRWQLQRVIQISVIISLVIKCGKWQMIHLILFASIQGDSYRRWFRSLSSWSLLLCVTNDKLYTLYLLAYQVTVGVGYLGLCCHIPCFYVWQMTNYARRPDDSYRRWFRSLLSCFLLLYVTNDKYIPCICSHTRWQLEWVI